MKPTTISISMHNVEQRIQTHTYYTGEARREAGAPAMLAAGIQASDDDRPQLHDHIRVAAGELAAMLTRYLSPCTTGEYDKEGEPTLTFTIITPPGLPPECIRQIKETMESYAVMRTLQLWTAQHKPDESPLAAGEAQTLTAQMRVLMATRRRPQRLHSRDKNTIDI